MIKMVLLQIQDFPVEKKTQKNKKIAQNMEQIAVCIVVGWQGMKMIIMVNVI